MLSWPKRLLERVWFALKLGLVLVVMLIPPIVTLTVAQKAFHASLPLAFLLAIAADFVLFWLWLLFKGLTRALKRFAGFLWRIRIIRWGTCFAIVATALLVIDWNIARTGADAWIFILCVAASLAALASAFALSKDPTRIERMMEQRLGREGKSYVETVRVLLWLVGIALIDAWLHVTVADLLGANWIVIPWSVFSRIHVPLAWIPPILFTIGALFAGPPRLRRDASRWTWTIWWLKEEKIERIDDRKIRVLISFPLIDLSIGRVLKMNTFETPDRRKARKPAPGARLHLFRMFWTAQAFVTLVSVLGLKMFADWFMPNVPVDLSSVTKYQPAVTTVVNDRNGSQMCSFSLENRIWMPLERIPKHVQDAFIAAEDKHFWEHEGIDPEGIVRAGVANFRSGEASQGASTLTQQVIKQIVLKDSSRTMERKMSEIILAVRYERRMREEAGGDRIKAKQMILEIYLNHVYLGKNAYGVEAAAQTYFGKSVESLTIAEAAILAGLPKAPSDDSPIGHYDRAKVRQRYVLGRMVETGAITRLERTKALGESIALVERANAFNMATAPYACEEVRKYAEGEFGWDAVYKQGLIIDTTFDMELQRKAQASVRYGLLDLERRLGFAGPEGHDKDATDRCDGPADWVPEQAIEANARVIARGRDSIDVCVRGNLFPLDHDDVERVGKWERSKRGNALAIGDLLTVRVETREGVDGTPRRYALTARRTGGKDHPEALQAGLVAIDRQSGEIRAIVGGYDWNESQYNNATQARRQTGSSIKPYVYLTALMNGKTVVSTEMDGPICVSTASGPWCPGNYDVDVSVVYYGTVDLVTALAKSLNSVSVRLAVEVGLDKIIGTIRALGIRSPIVRVFPLAIGTPQLTLWEHTAGYAAIMSNGRSMAVQKDGYPPGIFVKNVKTFVRDAQGRAVLETIKGFMTPARPDTQAVPAGDAYAMTELMRGVVRFGTGKRAQYLLRPVAGKTGTTNSNRDVWFMGGTADLTVGVWIGRNTPAPIAKKATGGGVALPIWEAFMEAAFPVPEDGVSFIVPPRDFPIPDDVTLIHRDQAEDGRARLLPFQRGKMPEPYLDAPDVDFGRGEFR